MEVRDDNYCVCVWLGSDWQLLCVGVWLTSHSEEAGLECSGVNCFIMHANYILIWVLVPLNMWIWYQLKEYIYIYIYLYNVTPISYSNDRYEILMNPQAEW